VGSEGSILVLGKQNFGVCGVNPEGPAPSHLCGSYKPLAHGPEESSLVAGDTQFVQESPPDFPRLFVGLELMHLLPVPAANLISRNPFGKVDLILHLCARCFATSASVTMFSHNLQ